MDADFATALERRGFAEPVVWGSISSTSDRSELRDVPSSLGLLDDVPNDVISARLDCTVPLSERAKGIALTALRQPPSMPPEYFHMDRAEAAKKARFEELDASRLRLRAPILLALPTQWKGKRFFRLKKTGDPRAHLRPRPGSESVGAARSSLCSLSLVFLSDLETRSVEWTSVEAMSCPKGLRAASLRKRVSDWEPIHRFILSERGLHFPIEAWQILEYFEVRREERAARSVYGSLLSSMRFLKEAGDVPVAQKLSSLDALLNAVKELETARAKQAEREGEISGGQAPPLFLALLAAMERYVLDSSQPLYCRAHGSYRLTRHWASLRFSDTLGLAPCHLTAKARATREP